MIPNPTLDADGDNHEKESVQETPGEPSEHDERFGEGVQPRLSARHVGERVAEI